MGKYQTHMEYREAENLPISKIPTHWRQLRLKYVFKEIDERANGAEAPLLGLTRDRGIINRSEIEQRASQADTYDKYKLCEPNDLVMNKMQAWNGIFGLSSYFGMVSPDYSVFRSVRPMDLRFIQYLVRTPLYAGAFFMRCRGMGTAFLRLNTEDFGDTAIPYPPEAEQVQIAAFLDHETARIDRLIARQERLIELLKEKRQAVIAHAVTKGLDPHAPMKDSGVAWLSEVPAHWEVARLKHVATLQSGVAKGRDLSGRDTMRVPYLRVANVQDGYLTLDDVAEIEIQQSELTCYLLKDGDVLMNEGGDNDKLGRGAVWRGEVQPCIHQNHVFAIRPQRVQPEWLTLVTQSSYAKFYFFSVAKQSTNLASISSRNIKETPLVIPPVDERAAIWSFVDGELEKYDRLVSLANRQISLLTEHRTALISAAVTGKIDVRGWQKPNHESQEAATIAGT